MRQVHEGHRASNSIDAAPGAALLGAADPPPVRITNPGGRSSFLLIGDHAGKQVPQALGSLGLSEAELDRHIGWDIGVARLGRLLAERLDAVFVEQSYSRLVIDCNRSVDRPDAIAAVSDGTTVPGNAGLSEADRAARITEVHAPYHTAIADMLAERDAAGRETILLALHSFTPIMAGFVRPWDIGVLHHLGDTAYALALLEALRATGGMVVGDNEPYQMDGTDFTIPHHAYAARRPYAELEIRQDHLADAEGCALWAERVIAALNSVAG